ncbi:hypothetical protein, partial [Hallella multisaccharivorax]|uniref:hypothetical protein n=1 Tax=Hallella multisaccharivorax TaxID=310514 RepID=UPI00361C6B6F
EVFFPMNAKVMLSHCIHHTDRQENQLQAIDLIHGILKLCRKNTIFAVFLHNHYIANLTDVDRL